MSAAGGLGMMIGPPLVGLLIEAYGWKGAMLLLGAINANNIVCGALYHPIDEQQRCIDGYLRTLDDEDKIVSVVSDADDDYDEVVGIVRDDVENNEMCNKESSTWTSLRSSLTTGFHTFHRYMKFFFVDNYKMIFIIMAEILSGVVFAGWAIFLVPHTIIQRGMSPLRGSFLSTSGAAGIVLGRLLMGPMIQNGYTTAIQLYIIYGILNAAAFFVDVLFDQFWILVLLAFVNGMSIGTVVALSFGATIEILGERDAMLGYSVTVAFLPVGDLMGGLLLGKSALCITYITERLIPRLVHQIWCSSWPACHNPVGGALELELMPKK